MKVIVIQCEDSVDVTPIVLGSYVTVNTVTGKVTFVGQSTNDTIPDHTHTVTGTTSTVVGG